MKTPYKCSLTYFTKQNCFCQTLPTFCWRKVKHIKVLMRSTNKASNSFLVSKQAYKRGINQWLCRTTMGRGNQTWVKAGNFFDWLEIYEPITYFSFSTRIFRNRNMLLNISILRFSIKMYQKVLRWKRPQSTLPFHPKLHNILKKRLSIKFTIKVICTWNTVLYTAVVISMMNFFGGKNIFT